VGYGIAPNFPSLTSATAESLASIQNSTPVRRVENSFMSQAAAATSELEFCSGEQGRAGEYFSGENLLGFCMNLYRCAACAGRGDRLVAV
jgi:hypothetical protein